MSICNVCNGKGMVDDPMWADEAHTMQYLVARMKKCPACGGSGVIVQTNGEWFCSLPTEEKAEFLYRNFDDYDFCDHFCEEHCDNDTGRQCHGDFKRHWAEWLKEVHKE